MWRGRDSVGRPRGGIGPRIGGLLLSLGGVLLLMGIVTAEAEYPSALDYTTRRDQISYLGSTPPPHVVIVQPSAHIFDGVMMLSGAILVVAALLLHASHRSKLWTTLLLILGAGVAGVGIFPDNHHGVHQATALVTFLIGGLTAASSAAVTRGPFRYFGLALGLTSLTVFWVGPGALVGALGPGGVERWVAYPILLWAIAYGGYVLGSNPSSSETVT